MRQCEAKQFSDLMACERCGLRWDVNDPDPPKCAQPIERNPMATVTITITDKQDGKLSLKIESDPAFPGPKAKDQTITAAQHLGMLGMEAITDACKSGKG